MINDYLKHYASEYYDPDKAHEYYMKNRELKGRTRSTSSLSDDGKDVWATTKDNITAKKKEAIQEESDAKDKDIENFRANAAAARARISEKLQTLNAILTEQANSDKEKIADEKERSIDTINTNTTNSVESLQATLKSGNLTRAQQANIRQKIAEIKNDASTQKDSARDKASTDRKAVSDQLRADKKQNSEDAKSERAEVSSQLKDAIATAREKFKTAKAEIIASYEDVYQNEYDKISSEYKKPTTTKSSSSSSKSGSNSKIKWLNK